jgi:putative molybdopterin biosynthesis protein
MPDSPKPEVFSGRELAAGRLARGLTQAGLARQIGVSRQFLNQMEAGRVLPNVVIALRAAAALGRPVEELFGGASATAAETLPVAVAAPGLATGARLRLGRVGRTWVAHAADTPGSLAGGFASADAVLAAPDQARLLVAPAAVAANLLLAGCDPALALLQTLPTDGGSRCHWIDCGSGRALDLLAAGQVHVAGIHYSGTDGAGNVQELQRRDPKRRWGLVRFTRWEQGWMLRRGQGQRFSGIADLGSGKWTLANRDETTAARRWLDQQLAKARLAATDIPGFRDPVSSVAEGARAVADGRADVTVGPRALAVAHGLDFVPAEAVDFDLVAPAVWWRSAAGQELKKRLTALAAAGVLASLPGYAVTESGAERVRAKTR